MQRQIHFDNKFSTALFIFQFIEFDIRLRITTNFIELNQNVPYEVNSNLEVKHNDTAIFHMFYGILPFKIRRLFETYLLH